MQRTTSFWSHIVVFVFLTKKTGFAALWYCLFKGYCTGAGSSVSRSSLINASQNTKFSTKFPTLNKDFSEMRKFQPKPLKPRCDICLKTPNPEGFWVTPKTRQDLLITCKLIFFSKKISIIIQGSWPFKEGLSNCVLFERSGTSIFLRARSVFLNMFSW